MSNDPLYPGFPGQPVSAEEAMPIISRLRRKYHQGPPERNNLTSERLERYFKLSYPRETTRWPYLPDDIREHRIQQYGDPLENVSTSGGGIVLTWSVFPETAIPTTLGIFSHPHFQQYKAVYFSHLTFGDRLYLATPVEVQEYFAERFMAIESLYVFDHDLKWCISVATKEYIFLVGDFRVF